MRRLTGIQADSQPGDMVKRWYDEDILKSFMWPREMFNAIQSQGCGSCSLFPFVDQLEFLYRQWTGEVVQFSRQFGIDCTYGKFHNENKTKTLWGCGCGGGSRQSGPTYMKENQYYPLTGAYGDGHYHGSCSSQDDRETLCGVQDPAKNGFTKLWLADYIGLSHFEEDVLREVEYMPVYMAFYIGNSFFKKSGKQPFTDVDCAKDTMVHAMLLVGYDEKTLTFRNSYGKSFGDGGYVHINRGPLTRTCNYWKEAQVLTVSYRREIQYAKVSGEYNFNDARAECQKMDTDTESGWDLAIIPTQMHQNQLMKVIKRL